MVRDIMGNITRRNVMEVMSKEIRDVVLGDAEPQKCAFCPTKKGTFPLVIPGEGWKFLCNECVAQIPEYIFVRCAKCKNTFAAPGKEDHIMASAF